MIDTKNGVIILGVILFAFGYTLASTIYFSKLKSENISINASDSMMWAGITLSSLIGSLFFWLLYVLFIKEKKINRRISNVGSKSVKAKMVK